MALCLTARAAAPAADIAVIVARDDPRPRIERAELVRIFLRRERIDRRGRRVVPVNLPAADPVRRAFSSAVLGGPPEVLRRYWDERYFHGVLPPVTVGSVEAMLRFIAVTPGAVGYVPACRVDERVRVVARIELPEGGGPSLCPCAAQAPACTCRGSRRNLQGCAPAGRAGD